MDKIVYLACVFTSLFCTVLLFRAFRRVGSPLLLWSGICFSLLFLSSCLLYADYVWFPDFNGAVMRSSISLIALVVLLFGLITRDA
jgi:hypothetical protein